MKDSIFLNGGKEAEEFMGNQPIFVSLGSACVFKTKLKCLAAVDLSEIGQHVSRSVDENHGCKSWGEKVLPQIAGGQYHCAIDFVIVHRRNVRGGTDTTPGYAADRKEKIAHQ